MAHLVPRLPDDAPFTPEQRAWLNGFFAGMGSRGETGLVHPATMESGDGQATPMPVLSEPEPYGRANPYPAHLAENRRLSLDGSSKHVRHMVVDVSSSGMTYATGDALGVVPQNDPAYVDALLGVLELDANAPVDAGGVRMSLQQALQTKLDVTQPPKSLLEMCAAEIPDLHEILDDRQALNDYLWGRDVLDLVIDAPRLRFDEQAFVDLLRPLRHRLYSISSSPVEHLDQIHLTVAAVRYEANGRLRHGVCSTYLADRCDSTTPLPVFVQPNKNFRLPADPDAPIVMIGPGTGIAPFRAFLQERRATGARGKNWLFFGDRHADSDFLYGDELLGFLEDGTLDRLDLAWSRDGARKVYVQHRMMERAGDLYAWLEEGASVYVCGDASRMAKDVDAALHRLVATEGRRSEGQAADYVKQLKSEKRYLRDVY